MPLTTSQRSTLNQFMQITGVSERNATRVCNCYLEVLPIFTEEKNYLLMDRALAVSQRFGMEVGDGLR